MADAGRRGPPDRHGDRIAARRRRAGQPALAVGGPRAHPRPDARCRQHLPQPGHERGGPRGGPAGVRVRRSASNPSSGDARRHGAGGRPALRAAPGLRRPRRVARSPTPTLDARSDEVAAGLRAAGLGPGDVVVLRLPSDGDLRGRVRRGRQGGRGHRRREPPAGAARAGGGGRPRRRRAHDLEPPTRWRRCAGRSSRPRSLRRSGPAGRPRVHLGHHRPAEGGAVPRTAARRRHPHRRRRCVGGPGHGADRRCWRAPSSPTSAS